MGDLIKRSNHKSETVGATSYNLSVKSAEGQSYTGMIRYGYTAFRQQYTQAMKDTAIRIPVFHG